MEPPNGILEVLALGMILGLVWGALSLAVGAIRDRIARRRRRHAKAAALAAELRGRGYDTVDPELARYGEPIVLDTTWNRCLAELEGTIGSDALPPIHRLPYRRP